MKKPLVSIITLNYNQTDITCAFLRSTQTLTYDSFEIIVVDNASVVNPTEQVRQLGYDNLKLIINKVNVGFAGGNNLGIQAAKGDYLFIVNNDTEVASDLLEKLLLPFSHDPKIGVVSPKIKFYDHPNVIQYAGFRPMNPLTGRTGAVGGRELDRGQYDTAGETYGAHGAAMMIKREIIETVGMMDERFFLYYEEWDWSARIRRAGYKIFYQPQATVYHKESMTVGKNSTLKTYYHTRNRILYMRRNSKSGEFLIFLAFLICFTVPKSVISYLWRCQFEHLKAFVQGLFWHLGVSAVSR